MSTTEFDKIAGYKEEKKELINLCNLIKNSHKLKLMGGKLPKGLLLIGPNGVGKSVLAKAFIKEANCNCISIDYNDLDKSEEFSTYIKEKFAKAASQTPCIIFVDELDKLIGNSNQFFMGENFDRSRIFLNQINKYSKTEGLFLLLVANQHYVIDPSIARSGRIDRTIRINLPNEGERKQILRYYSNEKPLNKTINLTKLSKMIKGFSGADIEALLNDSVIKAFSDNRKTITWSDITSTYYDKVFQCKSKDVEIDETSKKLVAYHEAGHTVVALLINPKSVNNVTINSRDDVKGFLSTLSSEDKVTTFVDEKNKVRVALGGIAAEDVFFSNRTTGSTKDIHIAKNIIGTLVRKLGISGLDKIDIPLSIGEEFPPQEQCSEKKKKDIETAEDNIICELFKETILLIRENKGLVEHIAEELIRKRILNSKDLDKILNQYLNEKTA